MATKHIIASGIGFSPGGVNFIVTRGLLAGVAVVATSSSGVHRLNQIGQAKPYRSIDWSVPLYDEPQKEPVPMEQVSQPEPPRTEPTPYDLSAEQSALSDINTALDAALSAIPPVVELPAPSKESDDDTVALMLLLLVEAA